jgi:hypothetical protein
MLVVEAKPPRKHNHLVLVTQQAGGLWNAACMGQAKRCNAGEFLDDIETFTGPDDPGPVA